MMMYKSLVTSGQKALASGPLVDAIRRARCFGVCLAPLDIRQVGFNLFYTDQIDHSPDHADQIEHFFQIMQIM